MNQILTDPNRTHRNEPNQTQIKCKGIGTTVVKQKNKRSNKQKINAELVTQK